MQYTTPSQFTVHLVPILKDNYVFILEHQTSKQSVIIDPGSGPQVAQFVRENNLKPLAILNTHHHSDHIGANAELKQLYRIPIYAPPEPNQPVVCDYNIAEGRIIIGPFELSAIATPGHTLGHHCFLHSESKSLFCGDALFSLGCGRVFEGTFAQTWTSLQKLAQLSDSTQVYCAHEYTHKNLRFTEHEDFNYNLAGWQEFSLLLSSQKRTIPTLLKDQKLFNPFINFKFNPSHALVHQNENEHLNEFTRRRILRNQY